MPGPAPTCDTKRPFEKLIAPVSALQFFAEYFEQEPLVLKGRGPDAFDDILSVQDLIDYFDAVRHPQDLSVMKDGQRVPPDQWSSSSVHTDGTEYYTVDRGRIVDLIHAGHSIRLRGAHRTIPKLTVYCNDLAEDLGIPLQVNVYISPSGQGALATHYDTHDVFALQLHGTKTWQLYDSPLPLPTPRQRYTSTIEASAPSKVFDLSPGDLAYVPRGLMHNAETKDGVSIHLALGLKFASGVDLAEALLTRLQDHVSSRRALPHGYSSDADRAARLAGVAQAVSDVFSDADIESLARDHQQAAKSNLSVPVPDVGGFRALLASGGLSANTVLRGRLDRPYSVQTRDASLIITVGAKTMTLPRVLEASVQSALGGNTLRLGEIAGLISPAGKISLVEKLLELGLVEICNA